MENSWIIPVIILIVICFFLWKYGKFREDKESIYKKAMKCPFDNDFCAVEERSIVDGYVTAVCSRCPRWKSNNKEIMRKSWNAAKEWYHDGNGLQEEHNDFDIWYKNN